MSRFDDEMIAAEDRPPFPFPARTLEAWMQLEAGLQVAEVVTIAAPVDWSALALAGGGAVQFSDYAAMARTLNGGQLTYESWGKLALVNPIVNAALDAAEREERSARPGALMCDACTDAGVRYEAFEWGGALFIHLLSCPHFAKRHNSMGKHVETIRVGTMKKCELQGCKSKGAEKDSVGRFQVYDAEMNMATMNRPAHLCQRCVDFSKSCGMEPRKE